MWVGARTREGASASKRHRERVAAAPPVAGIGGALRAPRKGSGEPSAELSVDAEGATFLGLLAASIR